MKPSPSLSSRQGWADILWKREREKERGKERKERRWERRRKNAFHVIGRQAGGKAGRQVGGRASRVFRLVGRSASWLPSPSKKRRTKTLCLTPSHAETTLPRRVLLGSPTQTRPHWRILTRTLRGAEMMTRNWSLLSLLLKVGLWRAQSGMVAPETS